MADGILDGFGGLDRIDEAKDVQAREKIILELLTDIEQKLLNKEISLGSFELSGPNGTITINRLDQICLDNIAGLGDCYTELYNRLRENELKNVDLTEAELLQFIDINVNQDCDDFQSVMLGLYTGVLLHILTERNAAQGNKTRFYVEGKGGHFPCLFMYARVVDEIIINNFKGDNIGYGIGNQEGGTANLVVGANIEGEYTLNNCGDEKGYIHFLISINNKGHDNCAFTASEGKADFVLIVGSRGDDVGHRIGFSGVVDLVMIVDNIGNLSGDLIGRDSGKINQVIIADNQGDKTGNLLCTENGSYIGSVMIIGNDGNDTLLDTVGGHSEIGLIAIVDTYGNKIARNMGDENSKIGKLLVLDSDPLSRDIYIESIDELLKGRDASEAYTHIKQIYPVDKMIELAHQMNAKPTSSQQTSSQQTTPKQKIPPQTMTYQQIDEAIRTAARIYEMHKANYPKLESWVKE